MTSAGPVSVRTSAPSVRRKSNRTIGQCDRHETAVGTDGQRRRTVGECDLVLLDIVRPLPELDDAITAGRQQRAVGAEGQRVDQIAIGRAAGIHGPAVELNSDNSGSIKRSTSRPDGTS